MAIQLIQKTEKFITDTEDEAVDLIEDYKNKAADGGYIVKKGNYTAKPKKSKGEIVDITYTAEITISYDV